MLEFLYGENGWPFVIDPADSVAVMEGFASDNVSEAEFRSWLVTGSSSIS